MTSASETVGIVEAEDAARVWLESKYLNVEAGHDPNDRDYSADEMVDAFIAGLEAADEQQAATIAERDARIEALETALGGLEPYLDAIVCYASTMGEHEPNRLVVNARTALAKVQS